MKGTLSLAFEMDTNQQHQRGRMNVGPSLRFGLVWVVRISTASGTTRPREKIAMTYEQIGPYRIVGTLGRGGMGVVYHGVNVETDEPAAIKILPAAMAAEEGFRQRFEVEIETLRKLYHPNIVQLFGFGEQDGTLFYAMEIVPGSSLEDELRRGRTFQWREAAQIAIQTCRALRHAHDRGVIHRDIKPANLLMDANGGIKLSDFGIARLFGNTRITTAGNVLGTAEYMSPEQASGGAIGPRSDLYSLGGVCFALLTRRAPFKARSLSEMLEKHRLERPDPSAQLCTDVPEEFERIIAQLLEKDPENRIANATLVARRLEAMLRAYPSRLNRSTDPHRPRPRPTSRIQVQRACRRPGLRGRLPSAFRSRAKFPTEKRRSGKRKHMRAWCSPICLRWSKTFRRRGSPPTCSLAHGPRKPCRTLGKAWPRAGRRR